MNNIIFSTRFKVILYKFSFDDYDPFDFYDFIGNRIIEKDKTIMTTNISVTDQEIDNLIQNINKNSLKDLPTTVGSALPSPPINRLDKNLPTIREYFAQFLKDKKSYNLTVDSEKSINWKNQPTDGNLASLSQAHNKYLESKIQFFKQNIVNKSLRQLINEGYVQEYDITDAVISIGNHETAGDTFKNHISFDLNLNALPANIKYLQENFVIDFYADFSTDQSTNSDTYVYGAYRGPATISELTSLTLDQTVNPNNIHTRRFIGIITGIRLSIQPGSMPICSIDCDGIYAYLQRNNLVKNRALATFFEKYPYDLKQPGVVVFADNLNALSVTQIFDYILYHVLDLHPYLLGVNTIDPNNKPFWLGDTTPLLESDENTNDILSDSRLFEVTGLTFTKNGCGLTVYRRSPLGSMRDLTSWSMLAVLYFIVHTKYSKELKNLNLEKTYQLNYKEYAYADICGISEGNEYNIRAYALQVKTSHATFYNQFSSGVDLLNQISSYTYFDMFEDRPGVLVCRPSRINQIFIDHPEYAKLFIINPSEVLSFSYSRSDKDLSSRVDYTPTLPLKGELSPRFCLNYADSQLLYKYGANLKENGPVSNPNVVLYNFMPFFAAVALVQRNALTRTIELSTSANRNYCLGRVYFIPDFFVQPGSFKGYAKPDDIVDTTGWVARLTSISTSYDVGSVPKHTLTFMMARRGKIIKDPDMKVTI